MYGSSCAYLKNVGLYCTLGCDVRESNSGSTGYSYANQVYLLTNENKWILLNDKLDEKVYGRVSTCADIRYCYFAGGSGYKGSQRITTSSVYRIDDNDRSIFRIQATNPPSAGNGGILHIFNNILYMLGGAQESLSIKKVFSLNLDTLNQWIIENITLPHGYFLGSREKKTIWIDNQGSDGRLYFGSDEKDNTDILYIDLKNKAILNQTDLYKNIPQHIHWPSIVNLNKKGEICLVYGRDSTKNMKPRWSVDTSKLNTIWCTKKINSIN